MLEHSNRESNSRTRARRFRAEIGFTLIELLVVVVVLGVLAGIVTIGVSGIRDKADTASCQTNEATISAAAEAYYLDNGSYPGSVAALVPQYIKKAPTGSFSIDAQGNANGNC